MIKLSVNEFSLKSITVDNQTEKKTLLFLPCKKIYILTTDSTNRNIIQRIRIFCFRFYELNSCSEAIQWLIWRLPNERKEIFK